MLHDVSQVRGDQDVEGAPFLEGYFDRVRKLNASHSWIPESVRGMRKKSWFPEHEN